MRGLYMVGRYYYVYTHEYRGKVFYVGMGKNGRAFSFDSTRGIKWKNFISRKPTFGVRIVKKFPTKEAALDYERFLISRLKPECNTHGIHRIKVKINKKYMISASEMGKRGAAATNKLLTTEKRRKAARKGWKLRKERLKNLKK